MANIEPLIETRSNEILADWTAFRDKAAHGFAQFGRGAFYIDLAQPYVPGGPVPYAGRTAVKQQMSDAYVLLAALSEYDPARQIVVIFQAPAGDTSYVRIVSAPAGSGPIVSETIDTAAATDFDDLYERITDRCAQVDRDGLPAAERVVWDVMELVNQVRSNGFVGFFYDCPERRLDIADALRTIGATDLLAIYADVCRTFGKGGPSADEDTFTKQLNKVLKKDDPWDAEESRFYEAAEALEPIVWGYWTAQRAGSSGA